MKRSGEDGLPLWITLHDSREQGVMIQAYDIQQGGYCKRVCPVTHDTH